MNESVIQIEADGMYRIYGANGEVTYVRVVSATQNYAPDDPEPCQPAADDTDDHRLTSKCKRLRREARGW